MPLPTVFADTLDEARGRVHRRDSVAGPNGGPAGNSHLTAMTGLLLLVLIIAELVTLIDVSGLISWHIVVGTLLVPVAMLKTASAFWRIVRYYGGNRSYRQAGAPPTPVRLLGPLVVLSTWGLLASGLLLIALGPEGSRRPFFTGLGLAVDPLTMHQGAFVAFLIVTGLHVVARVFPAVTLLAGRSHGAAGVPGRAGRFGVLVSVVVAAILAAVLVLAAAGTWTSDPDGSPAQQGAVTVVQIDRAPHLAIATSTIA